MNTNCGKPRFTVKLAHREKKIVNILIASRKLFFFERFKRPFVGLSSTKACTRSLAKHFPLSFLKAVIPKCFGEGRQFPISTGRYYALNFK